MAALPERTASAAARVVPAAANTAGHDVAESTVVEPKRRPPVSHASRMLAT